MSAPLPYLFVYGTLRRNSAHPMAAFLANNGLYLGAAKTPGRLYDLGPYPGMLEAKTETDWVHGEVYELANPDRTIAELDKYEGCIADHPMPWIFRREVGMITMSDGTTSQGWIYFYCEEVGEEKRITSGDYSHRLG